MERILNLLSILHTIKIFTPFSLPLLFIFIDSSSATTVIAHLTFKQIVNTGF